MPATLNLGWAADEPGFDVEQAESLCGFYQRVRPLLNKDWYPLTPYSRSTSDWLAVQFHDPALDQGLVLAFRREEAFHSLEARLRALDPEATYVVERSEGAPATVSGRDLLKGHWVSVDAAPGSEVLFYKKKGNS
jgi:hypothetical protein